MFDLEQHIQEWRRTLTRALGDRPEVADELESHLRDDVARRVQSGQTPEQAWDQASARLGSPAQLAAEFGKLPPPGPVSWLPARALVGLLGALAVVLAVVVLARLGQGKSGPLLAGHLFAVTAGYTLAFAVGTLAAWSILARLLRGRDDWRAEAFRSTARLLATLGLPLTAVGVVLGAWWAREHLGRAWGWDPREIGGLSVLVWYGLMLVGLARRRTELAGLLLGVLGNVVGSLSWFGANLLVAQHTYGMPTAWVGLLGAFVLLQMLLLGMALIPAGRLTRRGT